MKKCVSAQYKINGLLYYQQAVVVLELNQEMEELKRYHGSYVKNPSPQNVEDMVDAFFGGLKNLFNNLENWFMNMTSGYLRKLANALESRGCRNYSEYRRGIVRSGIER